MQNVQETQKTIVLKAHQPVYTTNYSMLDIGQHQEYFDEDKNKQVLIEHAATSYLPINKALSKLNLPIAMCVSGTLIDHMHKFAPELLQSFKQATSYFVAMPYYSAAHVDEEEFNAQMQQHVQTVTDMFAEPKAIMDAQHTTSAQAKAFVKGTHTPLIAAPTYDIKAALLAHTPQQVAQDIATQQHNTIIIEMESLGVVQRQFIEMLHHLEAQQICAYPQTSGLFQQTQQHNDMQLHAQEELTQLQGYADKNVWRKLSATNHISHMQTHNIAHISPYDAYLAFMNILTDIKQTFKS